MSSLTTKLGVAISALVSVLMFATITQPAMSFELVGVDDHGRSLFLSVDEDGTTNYDLLVPPQLLIRHFHLNGVPIQVQTIIDPVTFELQVTNGIKWEQINKFSGERPYTYVYSSNGDHIQVISDADTFTVFLDPISKKPKTYGSFTVTSWNEDGYINRPTANISFPTENDIFQLSHHREGRQGSRRRNLVTSPLFRSLSVSPQLKDCLTEAAYNTYYVSLVGDYTYYINHLPHGAKLLSNGSYALHVGTATGIVGSTLAASKYCNGVLLPGETVIAFQGTNNVYDGILDLESVADNFLDGYNGTLGVDTTVQYTYCVGHSLGGARAKWAGSMGLCKNVISLAGPIVDIGVIPFGWDVPSIAYTGPGAGTYPLPNNAYPPIVSFQRVQFADGTCSLGVTSSNGQGSWNMDVVPQVGYGFDWIDYNPNILYTLAGNPHSYTSVQPGGCPPTLLGTLGNLGSNAGSLHVLGSVYPFNALEDGY